MNRKERLLDIYSDGGEWEDFEPVIDEMENELATLRAQLAEARELIADAKVEIGFTLTGLTQPSNGTYNKLANYLKKVTTD